MYDCICLQAVHLKKDLAELNQSTTTLSDQLSTATARLHSMRTTLTGEIEGLEVRKGLHACCCSVMYQLFLPSQQQNIADMTDEITDRNETLSQIEVQCIY